MPQIKEIRDIPSENEKDEVVENFKSEGCTVDEEKQPDGKWTVRATCPDS